ncbi:MAG TPA: hypothetical protein VF125_11035 [Solirubrobacterales bacterium]
MTEAIVTGLEIYGPHALGFLLFAVPAAGTTAAAYLLSGEKVAASVASAVLSMGFGALLRQAWMAKKMGPKRKG